MGLFDVFKAKKCEVCGEKTTDFTEYKLTGFYSCVCTECYKKCSAELRSADFAGFSPEKVRKHIADKKVDFQRFLKEFNETEAITRGGEKWSKKIWSVDDSKGWWANAIAEKPDVFEFKQVKKWELEIDSSYVTGDPINYNEGRPDRAEFPEIPKGKKIDRMDFMIYVDHPYISIVKIPLIDTTVEVNQKDIVSGYSAGNLLLEAFEKYCAKHGKFE